MGLKEFKHKLFPLSDPKFYPQYAEKSSESEESNYTGESSESGSSGSDENNISSGSSGYGAPSGSDENNNSNGGPPTMQEKVIPNIGATKQNTRSSESHPSLIYKYFLENSLGENSKK